jgi:hypothetical protein
MGLSLGQSESPETVEDFSTPDVKDVEEKSSIVDNEEPIFDGELGYPSDPIKVPPRVWTRVDRDDLVKLSEMISKFIGVPQFAHEANSFRKFVAAPLLDRNGPGLGATQVVSQVMSQVMFRHQYVGISTLDSRLIPDYNHSAYVGFRMSSENCPRSCPP